MIFFTVVWKHFLFKRQSDVIWDDFPPQSEHTTAPPSFATSAWSHPLQHQHNIQETGPSPRIISPCNTTLLLCSISSPSTLPRSVPSLKLLSNGPTCWPLAGHPLLVWRQIRAGPWRASVSIRLQRLWPSSTDLFDWAMGFQMGPAGYNQATHPAIMDRGFRLLANQNVTTAPTSCLSIYLY